MKARKTLALVMTLILMVGIMAVPASAAIQATVGVYDGSGALTEAMTFDQLADQGLMYRNKEYYRDPADVYINGSVSIVGERAFEGWYEIGTMNMADSVTRIDEYAFSMLLVLRSITFSRNLEYIGDYAFNYTCQNISHLDITFTGMTAPALGQGVFDGIDSPFTIYVPEGATGFDAPEWAGLNIYYY